MLLTKFSQSLGRNYSGMVRIINTIIDLKFHRVFLTSEAFGGEKPVGSTFEGDIP